MVISNHMEKNVIQLDKNRAGRNIKSGNSSTEWETPTEFFQRLHLEFEFRIDVCASDKNHKCLRYLTEECDALQVSWHKCIPSGIKASVWMNPPYGRGIGAWVKKAYEESRYGLTVVGLLPANTGPEWWHEYVMRASEIRLVRGRIHFLQDGEPRKDTNFDSAVVIWRPGSVAPVLGSMNAREDLA